MWVALFSCARVCGRFLCCVGQAQWLEVLGVGVLRGWSLLCLRLLLLRVRGRVWVAHGVQQCMCTAAELCCYAAFVLCACETYTV